MLEAGSASTWASIDSLLILSDGKPGHYNQSVAFARLLGPPFEIRRVNFHHRLFKGFSYIFDQLGLRAAWLYKIEGDIPVCTAVVSAGSDTYYANRVLSHKLGTRSISIMLPRGYRYTYDLIIAQQHDQPPKRRNILSVPINLSCPQPQGLVERAGDTACVSLILGGSSRHCRMDTDHVKKQIQRIIELFPDAELLVTTSRRTPPEVEDLVKHGPFRYKVIASQDKANPIADFLAISDYVFVTEDSTSMISEAVSFGSANVEVLPLFKTASSKINLMLDALQRADMIHVFDGQVAQCNSKIDLRSALKEAWQ